MSRAPSDVWALIKDLVAAGTPAAVAMPQVIALCRAVWPGEVWDKAAALRFDEEARLASWLQGVLTSHPPERPLDGLWFGLYLPIGPGGACHGLYVGGIFQRGEAGDELEWVYRLSWRPEADLAPLPTLAAIPTGDEEVPPSEEAAILGAGWALPLAYAALLVRKVVSALPVADWAAPEVEVAVGHDSGDMLRIGALTRAGFVPALPTASG